MYLVDNFKFILVVGLICTGGLSPVSAQISCLGGADGKTPTPGCATSCILNPDGLGACGAPPGACVSEDAKVVCVAEGCCCKAADCNDATKPETKAAICAGGIPATSKLVTDAACTGGGLTCDGSAAACKDGEICTIGEDGKGACGAATAIDGCTAGPDIKCTPKGCCCNSNNCNLQTDQKVKDAICAENTFKALPAIAALNLCGGPVDCLTADGTTSTKCPTADEVCLIGTDAKSGGCGAAPTSCASADIKCAAGGCCCKATDCNNPALAEKGVCDAKEALKDTELLKLHEGKCGSGGDVTCSGVTDKCKAPDACTISKTGAVGCGTPDNCTPQATLTCGDEGCCCNADNCNDVNDANVKLILCAASFATGDDFKAEGKPCFPETADNSTATGLFDNYYGGFPLVTLVSASMYFVPVRSMM